MSDSLIYVQVKKGVTSYVFAKWRFYADKMLPDEKYEDIWMCEDKERVKYLCRDDIELAEVQVFLRDEGIQFESAEGIELSAEEKLVIEQSGLTDRSQADSILADYATLSAELDNATDITEIKEVLKRRLAGGNRTGISGIV